MFVMLAKQKLVGHAGNVIAHDDMARVAACHLLKRFGHGARLLEIESKKLFEAMDGAVAVFGNHRMIINVREQELFQLSIVLAPGVAKAAQALWRVTNVFGGANAGLFDKALGVGNQIADEQIDDLAQRIIEFELRLGLGVRGFHFAIDFAEKGDFAANKVEVKKVGLERVVEIRGVVGDFVNPVDELGFQWRTETRRYSDSSGASATV